MKKVLKIAGILALISAGVVAIYYPLEKRTSPAGYSSSEYGLSFSYPQNYAVLEKTETGERLQHTVVLFENTPGNNDILFGSGEATEGPPTITIGIFQNNLDSYTLQSFVEGTSFSNFKLSDGTKEEITVAGKPAWRYRATGLYENDNVVVVSPEYVYMFTVFFNSPDDQIIKDFDAVLKTVEFPDIEKSVAPIGGERDSHGCLVPAGFAFDEGVGACIRGWEMTADIKDAAALAVSHVGRSYALTVASFNSYEEIGAYDIMLEDGVERVPLTVAIRKGKVQVIEPSLE